MSNGVCVTHTTGWLGIKWNIQWECNVCFWRLHKWFYEYSYLIFYNFCFLYSATTYTRFRLAQPLCSNYLSFWATFFQLCMFMFYISSKTSSSQHVLGPPIGLLDMGFHFLIFCTILSSAMCSTWPNQFNLCFLINPIIF